jgi:signal transduction histidine kinase
MVRGDSERFRHLIAHLTNNAFKQCSNVKVDVNLIRTKDDVSIVGLSVQDSGPGMSEAELDVSCSLSLLDAP